jgi:putative methionine-R-sulfoxide reductase with GAF domain
MTRDKEVSSLVAALLDALHGGVEVKDADGIRLAGYSGHSHEEHPLVLDGEVIGRVGGDASASVVASVLTYMVNREAEKRSLASDALDMYRELNLLYELSEKIGASLHAATVAMIAVKEACRRIKEGEGFMLLLDEATGVLAPIIASADGSPFAAGIRMGEDIIGQIALSGQAEVVDLVDADPRRSALQGHLRSLVCAPLKARQRVIGVVGVGSLTPVNYTAADLKFLVAIASQVAPAIDNAMLYERTVKEAYEREEQLRRQVEELRIEVDQSRQSRQVAAITGTDYFQALRQQASDLRKDLHTFD